jgi:hypothetical protein
VAAAQDEMAYGHARVEEGKKRERAADGARRAQRAHDE